MLGWQGGAPETVHIAECDAIEAISTVSVLSFHVRLKASCRLVVTAEGFDGRLVHAAQQLVSIQQAKCNSPETYIPSPGRPCPTFYQYFVKPMYLRRLLRTGCDQQPDNSNC